MRVLITAATAFEIGPLETFLKENFTATGNYQYQKGSLEVVILISGVGLPITSYHLAKMLALYRFDWALNVGIAGAFNRKLALGDVVQVVSQRFGDLGVEEADGQFTDMHQLGLIDGNIPPFQNGELLNPASETFEFLPKVKSISVNKVHGYPPSIKKIQAKYEADIESMEGAAFFYACLSENIPFLEVRSISNYVEARNRENWEIGLAIEQLNEVVREMIKGLQG